VLGSFAMNAYPAAEPPKPAAEGQKATEETAGGTSVLDVIIDSGAIGWLTVLLNFVAYALALQYLFEYRRKKMFPTEVVAELEELLNRQQYQEAIELCEVENCPLTNMVGAALSKLNNGYDSMTASMTEVADDLMLASQQKISYLALIGNVAPMLGLLGTVVGMVMSFDTIYRMEVPRPRDLAHGIAVALYTTVIGLVVAIPVLSIYQIIANRTNKYFLECTAIATQLIERFKPGVKSA